ERALNGEAPRAAIDRLLGGWSHGRCDSDRAQEHDRRWVRGPSMPGGDPDDGDGPNPPHDDRHHERRYRCERDLHVVPGSVPAGANGDIHYVRGGWFVAGG